MVDDLSELQAIDELTRVIDVDRRLPGNDTQTGFLCVLMFQFNAETRKQTVNALHMNLLVQCWNIQ